MTSRSPLAPLAAPGSARSRAPASALALALALSLLLPACSTQTAYATMMEMRKQECRKLPDLAERARCEKDADRSYDSYKGEAETPRRKP